MFENAGYTDQTGSSHDFFIVKYDALGNAMWVKTAGGFQTEWANAIAFDGNQNIFVAGVFNSTLPLFGTDTLSTVQVVLIL